MTTAAGTPRPVAPSELQHWLERARELGALGAEILVADTRGLHVEVHHGRIQARRPTVSRLATVTAWAAGGGHATTEGDPSALGDLVAGAVAAAAAAPADAAAGPARPVQTVDPRNLSIDDRRWEQLTEHDRVEAALALERAAREVDPRVHLEPLTWEDGRTHRLFASSAGLRGEEHGTTFSAAAAVRVAAEDAIVALSERVWSRSFSTLASLPFAASMARRAVAMLGPRAHVAGPVRVMFAPHATAALLGGLVESLFDPALEGQTFLDRGKPLSPRLHVLDDGQLAGGLFARSFDDRGVPPVPVVVIREGRRDQRFLGPAAARGADTRPTGHWRDGRLRPTNLVVRGGTRSINALLSERADVETLVVTDLVGVDGVDWRTGEARLLAYGTLRRGNVEVGVVPGVHLVGRLDEALRQVVELSSDTDRVGAIDAPGLMVDGLVAAP